MKSRVNVLGGGFAKEYVLSLLRGRGDWCGLGHGSPTFAARAGVKTQWSHSTVNWKVNVCSIECCATLGFYAA